MVFWRKQPILKGYVSEIDRFLREFDHQSKASSVARGAEEAKYRELNALRDNSAAPQRSRVIWEDDQI